MKFWLEKQIFLLILTPRKVERRGSKKKKITKLLKKSHFFVELTNQKTLEHVIGMKNLHRKKSDFGRKMPEIQGGGFMERNGGDSIRDLAKKVVTPKSRVW